MIKNIKKIINGREEYYPNIQIFSYHFLKFIHKLLVKIKLVNPPQKKQDMFNWSLYHLHYKGELKKESKNLTQSLKSGDYIFANNKLIKENFAIKPLHFAHSFLYETILQLNPGSVFEMGCGTGMHLHNIKVLMPAVRIAGTDLSEQQLKSLRNDYPELANSVKQADATKLSAEKPFDTCDLAFTQAVIMHIHTNNLYLIALENLFAMSSKYVILMEGIRGRNYKNDIQKLFDQSKISWPNIFFYYRMNEEVGRPNGIICSTVPLPYPELKDYNIYHEKK